MPQSIDKCPIFDNRTFLPLPESIITHWLEFRTGYFHVALIGERNGLSLKQK